MECGRDWEREDAENERMTIEMRNDAKECLLVVIHKNLLLMGRGGGRAAEEKNGRRMLLKIFYGKQT